MRGVALVILLAAALSALIACRGEQPQPTLDIEATVEVGVRATLEADASRVATIEARTAAEVARQP